MTIVFDQPTAEELRARELTALARVGLSYEELADFADRYMLTTEEMEAWDEIRAIRYLLDDE